MKMSANDDRAVPDVRREILARVQRTLGQPRFSGLLQGILAAIPQPLQPMIFGGFIRDLAIALSCGASPRPLRDMDFVVFGAIRQDEVADRLAKKFPLRRTTFGGIKVTLNDVTVDLWTPDVQLKVAGSDLTNVAPLDLLQFVTLTTDAVLYDPQNHDLIERSFVSALLRREIDVGVRSRWIEPWAALHLAHLGYVCSLTGFSVSESAARRVRETVSAIAFETAKKYLESHKGRGDAEDILNRLLAASGASVPHGR